MLLIYLLYCCCRCAAVLCNHTNTAANDHNIICMMAQQRFSQKNPEEMSSEAEVSAAAPPAMAADASYQSIQDLFDAIDVNNDGQLDKGELLRAVTRRRAKEPHLDRLFTELVEVFPKLRLMTKPGSVRAALLEMDTDCDGTVSAAELVRFCQTADDDLFVYNQAEEGDLREPKAQLEPGDVLLPEDVLAKAERLGIDVAKETHLIWIAHQALRTPLPPDWEYSWVADEGRVLYHNLITDDRSVSHPANPYFKQMVQNQRAKPLPRTAGMDGAWMRFETSQRRAYFFSFTHRRRVKKCPFGVKLLGRPHDVQFSVLDEPEAGEDGTVAGSKVQPSFSSSKLLDEQSSSSRRAAGVGGRGRGGARSQGSATRHIRDLAVLEFKSWWTEQIQGMEKGSKRRYMDLLFSCETGQFQVILDRSDKVYTLSHIEGKHGPLEAWDLFVGARVNVLGRTTTLMQASGPTLDWLDYHCQRLKRARNALKRELKKYSMKVRTVLFDGVMCLLCESLLTGVKTNRPPPTPFRAAPLSGWHFFPSFLSTVFKRANR